ncbi:MAG: hypothetical protein JWP82_1220, partial [Humibacillus sp.]|nr:hypothetical protein [Humibacillus sp.]
CSWRVSVRALPEAKVHCSARGALSRLEVGEPAPQETEHRGFDWHTTTLAVTTDSAPAPGHVPMAMTGWDGTRLREPIRRPTWRG